MVTVTDLVFFAGRAEADTNISYCAVHEGSGSSERGEPLQDLRESTVKT